MCKDPEQPVWQQRAGEGQEVARKASQGPLERAVEGHRRLALVNGVRAEMRFYGPKIGTKQFPRNIESHKSEVEVCFCASKWTQQRKP